MSSCTPLVAPRALSLFILLAVPLVLALIASPLAAQHRAGPSQSQVLLLGHDEPDGPGCGQWGKLTMRTCDGSGECRPEQISVDATFDLYDRLDGRIETLVAETCEARECPGFEFRNDVNHFECRSQNTCMQRSLVYRCIRGADEPEAPAPARRAAPQPGASPMVIDADAARMAIAAPKPEVDLAFLGRLLIGGKHTDWGEVVELRRSDAEVVENGRCQFRYRFSATNQGDNPAGAHVNRLRLGEHVLLAEHPVESVDPGRRSSHAGLVTLWSGENMMFAHLDDDEQLNDIDRTNNLRRVKINLAEGCADPRPRARAPGGEPRHIPRPVGRPKPPEPETPTGTRAPTTSPPPRTGSRAAPPQGRPAPGTQSKPVPQDGPDCRGQLSATRVLGVSRSGARATAIAAWEASAFAMHGFGYRWDSAANKSTQCNWHGTWTCTVSGRPCQD